MQKLCRIRGAKLRDKWLICAVLVKTGEVEQPFCSFKTPEAHVPAERNTLRYGYAPITR